jgi:lipoprotein-anchoring transpeptidase ErfK/SrfK
MGHKIPRRTATGSAILMAPLAVGLAACSGSGSGNLLASTPYEASGQVAYSAAVGKGARTDPSKPLEITAKGRNQITDVTATDAKGRHLRGELAADGSRWHSTSPLVAGAHYTVRVSTEDALGRPGRNTVGFDTVAGKQLRVTFGPESGTYGVGQPVTAALSAPVKDAAERANVERDLHVAATPKAVQGAWYWVDSKTLHYRPREYWPTHARIAVSSKLEGVRVRDGLYGGPAKSVTLRTGDRVEAVTNAGSHYMTFKRNGQVVRTIPVTTGKPGFSTRNGIKVVLGQESLVRMDSNTVGIAAGSSEAYDLPVLWATRVTWSGEYVHAAPWSVAAQGHSNVSHGCTGMSTENAHWFFKQVRRGDIVQVVGSLGPTMTPFDNGFGDWNLSWAAWMKGSATGARAEAAAKAERTEARPRLRPEV